MSIILGIDPGSRITGYGIIKQSKNQLSYVASGCIRTGKGDLASRLLMIHDGIRQIIAEYSPTTTAIEQVFMHQNANAALKLGHARGVAMVVMAAHCLDIAEYSARQIKQAVVGYGAASKEQVQTMVLSILGLAGKPQADAADGLAVAICHAHMQQGLTHYLNSRAHVRGRIR